MGRSAIRGPAFRCAPCGRRRPPLTRRPLPCTSRPRTAVGSIPRGTGGWARGPMHDKILIIDFGSQVTQLIARRVREEGVYSEIVPFNKAEPAFAAMKPKGVILS